MSKINVVLATDANYLNYLEVTLKSLLAHNENLSVFVMNTGDISSEWVADLQPYFEKRNCTLRLVYLDKAHLSHFNSSGYISTATYLRFYIPSIFEFSENPYWIYLDCDTVINGDVTLPFYEYNFSNYALGAVSDPYVNSLPSHPYMHQDYFNAGVLYLNANKLSSSFIHDLVHLTNKLKEKIIFGDQDILNEYFKNEWISLSRAYNFQLNHMVYSKGKNLSPCIMHFTGQVKPLGAKTDSPNVAAIISLFHLYHSLSWNEIVNLPLGTIKLRLD